MSNDNKTVFMSAVPGNINAALNTAQAAQNSASPAQGRPLSNFADNYRSNALLVKSQTLLTLLHAIKSDNRPADIAALHKSISEEIKKFDAYFNTQASVGTEVSVSARYILCAALDEAAVNTQWGTEANWSQHSLLSAFHNELSGGEKFFSILEKLLQTPSKYIDLIELVHVVLCLGFEGKYRALPSGKLQLEQVISNLQQTIAQNRPAPATQLSKNKPAAPLPQKQLKQLLPLWGIFLVFVLLLITTYSVFNFQLISHATDAQLEIDAISNRVQYSELEH